MSRRLSARQFLALVLDAGSLRSWDVPVGDRPADPDYAAALAAAERDAGTDEAVVSGEGTIAGRRVAVVACEFRFFAGSIGVVAAERLVGAVERATAERLPLLAAPSSGGTRLQEGTVAFLQMVKITAAVARHRSAGLPYLVYLRDPTTGGVFASWGSLGHVTAAEPGALVGFLGPRIYEALYGDPFPPGVQLAENLYERGIVDAVVPPEQIAGMAARALSVLSAPVVAEPADGPPRDVPAWESVRRSRRPDRPGVRDLLRSAALDVTPLHGTGEGEDDPGLLLALAKFGTAPCVVLGHARRRSSFASVGPAGLRVARRGMRLSAELGLPLLTVVDTAGAALTKEAEERGLAGEIARCLADLVSLPAPTVCLLLGEGAGGAALALVPADRVVCAQHGWLAPLPPEGSSVILYRDTDHAPEVAARQGVRSVDLLAAGVVDRVVSEQPDAADEPEAFLRRLAGVLEFELAALLRRDRDERLSARRERYRRIGLPPRRPSGSGSHS
jgi:acetyl-CoA carboxylase carboxyl transferase subunit beta